MNKFVSEEEVVEQRQKRQAEWEKIRKEDDPEECPEEETRTLFEQLQANKDVKDREYEDESKLRATVKGLDDEEVQFLNYVSNRQQQLEKERNNEEKSLLREMEAAKVIKMEDKAKDLKTESDKGKPTSSAGGKKSQSQLLSGAIKRKSVDTTDTDDQSKKRKSSEVDANTERPDAKMMADLPKGNGTAVVAGILPGISRYADDDSSTENSSNSSDSENDHMVYPSAITQRVLQEMMKKLKNECG